MGKNVDMKFEITESGKSEWFEGTISSYDGINKYSYFPYDQETVFASLDDEDLEIMDSYYYKSKHNHMQQQSYIMIHAHIYSYP